MEEKSKISYQRPEMKTVITPQEIRDIEQPCAFHRPEEKKPTENN